MNPIVNTCNGQVSGFVRNGNCVFRGIPYGDRCDGAYRFKAPRPAPNWEGVRDCAMFGPIAMQEQTDLSAAPEPLQKVFQAYADHFTGGIPYDKRQDVCSENCLVLNVVTPDIDDQKRPVLVYIHGGGFLSGSGAVTSDICDKLVQEENTVVVTVNHRLNLFGGLYLGDFDPEYANSGVAGMLDLVLALKWVQDNIDSFGGNAENVTLIGESGGAMKICHLMAMPEAKGLFQKVIAISGACKVGVKTKEQGTQEAIAVLKAMGLTPQDWRKLLELPAQTLVKAIGGANQLESDILPYYPTAEDVHIPFNAQRVYQCYEVSKDIPMLVGSSEEELCSNLLDNPFMTWENVRTKLLAQEFGKLQRLPGLNENNVDEIIASFRIACGDTKQPWQVYVQIISSLHFLCCGAYKTAMVRAESGAAPVWLWSTAYDSPVPGFGKLACAWHTADLPLVFRAVLHPEAEKLSRIMAHSFAAFARSGNPATESLSWKPFTPEEKQTMIFDEVCGCGADPYCLVRHASQLAKG